MCRLSRQDLPHKKCYVIFVERLSERSDLFTQPVSHRTAGECYKGSGWFGNGSGLVQPLYIIVIEQFILSLSL